MRAKNSRVRNHIRHFSVRVYNSSGREELIQFNVPDVNFDMRSGDVAVFSYVAGKLKFVQNLTIGQNLNVGGGCAFILVVFATAVAGICGIVKFLA